MKWVQSSLKLSIYVALTINKNEESNENIVGKGKDADWQHFVPFSIPPPTHTHAYIQCYSTF